ncbi:hypothetical protein HPB50_017196 [Hyalomma asiaticum]|uniref:Uncharacterized protein n=1 Tax=Hyalomma asiaticum TaxID=266040 RepID=A0ACB7TLX2_HYAAI|nr:hypothetical protein HPB50_017196 [Hyalomma asiaticum]
MTWCCAQNCRNCTENGKEFFAVPRAKSAVRRRLQCVLRMGRDRPVPKRPRECEVLHKEQRKKPARVRERAMHEVLEQRTKSTLLPDSDDEALQKTATTKKKTSKNCHLVQKGDSESDEERPTASSSGEGVKVKQEPN